MTLLCCIQTNPRHSENFNSPAFQIITFWKRFCGRSNTVSMENLHQLVARLMGTHLQVAVNNSSFFINDIPQQFKVEINSDWIPSVISRMLSIVAKNVRNTCIRLTATKNGNLTIL